MYIYIYIYVCIYIYIYIYEARPGTRQEPRTLSDPGSRTVRLRAHGIVCRNHGNSRRRGGLKGQTGPPRASRRRLSGYLAQRVPIVFFLQAVLGCV